MLLWHMGAGVALVYVTLGRRRVDYRAVLGGAVAPDLVDGALAAAGVFHGPAGRWVAHSMLAVVVVAVAVLLGTKGTRRLSLFGVAVGWLTHLVADGMWAAPLTFLWPAFGTAFSDAPREPYSWDLIADPLANLSTWGGEAVGAAVLAWFYVAFELGRDGRLRLFLKDGYLRP